MKPFDDTIPDEREPGQQELLAYLPHLYRKPASLPSVEVEQSLSKVRERLLHFQAIAAHENETELAQAAESIGSTVSGQTASVAHRRRSRQRRLFSILSTFVAVLVVGVIIGTAFLLFSHSPRFSQRPQSVTTPGMPADLSVTTYTSASGLKMSLGITRGPYFLSEMIAVTLSLHNGSSTSYIVGYPFVSGSCGYDPGVYITGGSPPNYTVPIPTGHSCPSGFYNSVSLKSGSTLMSQKYLPLTSSGHVTLLSEVAFLKSTIENGYKVFSPTSSPLDGHLPSAQITVSPKVPANRHVAFHIGGSKVTVIVPPQVHEPVLYLYGISCSGPIGLGQNLQPQETSFTGNYGWDPLTTRTVNDPGCGSSGVWSFAFGVPGYAIVTGERGEP